MKTELDYLISFRDHMVSFLDELIDQFPLEAAFILIRIFVKDQIPLADVLGRFIKECLPHHEEIKNKNEAFFLESDIIVNALGGSKIGIEVMDKLKSLWRSERLDNDENSWSVLFDLGGFFNRWEYLP